MNSLDTRDLLAVELIVHSNHVKIVMQPVRQQRSCFHFLSVEEVFRTNPCVVAVFRFQTCSAFLPENIFLLEKLVRFLL